MYPSFIGVRTLLHCARNLQGVRCSSYDVLQALATQLKYLHSQEKSSKMSLKYLDFSNCFAILSKYLFLLPNLIEIRIGSDAPPQMRQTTKRLLVDDSQMVILFKSPSRILLKEFLFRLTTRISWL